MGYSEGSFARVIDAVGPSTPLLPSVKTDPDFLCGNEFDALGQNLRSSGKTAWTSRR